jgi:hypothetical protein
MTTNVEANSSPDVEVRGIPDDTPPVDARPVEAAAVAELGDAALSACNAVAHLYDVLGQVGAERSDCYNSLGLVLSLSRWFPAKSVQPNAEMERWLSLEED